MFTTPNDAGQFTKKLISLMKVVMTRMEAIPIHKNSQKLKEELNFLLNGIEPPKPFDYSGIYMSEDAMEEIREWNVSKARNL